MSSSRTSSQRKNTRQEEPPPVHEESEKDKGEVVEQREDGDSEVTFRGDEETFVEGDIGKEESVRAGAVDPDMEEVAQALEEVPPAAEDLDHLDSKTISTT